MPFPMTINTQEEFDAAISERLSREKAKYADYDALKTKAGQYDSLSAQNYPQQIQTLKNQYDATAAELAELTRKTTEAASTNAATIADLQRQLEASQLSVLKSSVCAELGLPHTFAARLQGTNEAELKADAQGLLKFVVPSVTAPMPAATNEPAHSTGGAEASTASGGDSGTREAALRQLAQFAFGPQKGV